MTINQGELTLDLITHLLQEIDQAALKQPHLSSVISYLFVLSQVHWYFVWFTLLQGGCNDTGQVEPVHVNNRCLLRVQSVSGSALHSNKSASPNEERDVKTGN